MLVRFQTLTTCVSRLQLPHSRIPGTAPESGGLFGHRCSRLPLATTRLAATLLVAALSGAGPASAGIVFVNAAATGSGNGSSWANAYTTVQPALNAALAGDQVWVARGRYVGCITLKLDVALFGGFAGTENPITYNLGNRNFAVNETILDGNQAGSVVTGPTGATATCRIDGFTITNGSGTPLGSTRRGGGLYLSSSSPTIVNDKITGNSAPSGGGLYLDSSSPTISKSTISANVAAFSGGGLHLNRSSPTVTNSVVTDNDSGYQGGGLYLYASSLTISTSKITGNSADSGGGFYLEASSPTISRNTIAGNSAADSGGGLFLESSSAVIANNFITGNVADSGGGLRLLVSHATIANNTIVGNGASTGGGLSGFYYTSPPTIANNILAFNSSGFYNSADTSTLGILHNNCVYGNEAYNFLRMTDPTGTNGNLSVDPRLASREYGNVHIQPDSPCIGTGNNADAIGTLDIDGQLRAQGDAVDIGADESNGTSWSAGPYVTVRVKPDGDDGQAGSTWAQAKRTVQAAINAAALLGGDVWVQAGTYDERIKLKSHAHAYGGFAGDESARDERDWTTSVSIIDGQQQGSVVTVRSGYHVSTLDGFTITGGSGTSVDGLLCGGGLYLFSSSPVIANNAIMDNCADSGGGLYLYSSAPTLANNIVKSNTGTSYGGGLYLYLSSPRHKQRDRGQQRQLWRRSVHIQLLLARDREELDHGQ
jgi:hypothetical protein